MSDSIFTEMQFFLILIFSIITPVGVYAYLFKRPAVSRFAVLALALVLIAVAGVDVVLIELIAALAKSTLSKFDDAMFSNEVTLALLVFPAVSAGIGVNLLSQVLARHLGQAEALSERERCDAIAREPYDSAWLKALRTLLRISPAVHLSWLYFCASLIMLLLIFFIDLVTDSFISLHALYVFPVALTALKCDQKWLSALAFLMALALQIVSYSHGGGTLGVYIAEVFVAAMTLLLAIGLAMHARRNHINAIALATTDGLTNIANRRAFMASVDAEISRQARYGGTFSLAVLDLDGFKALNDTQGHRAGDEALRLVANILRRATRAADSSARIGGDEFAMLMLNTAEAGCRTFCQHITEQIATQLAAAGYAITASIGFHTFEKAPASTSAALAEADAAMYRVKAAHAQERGAR